MTDMKFSREELIACFKDFDPRTFKCEKILRDLEKMKILNAPQTLMLHLLKQDRFMFEEVEEKYLKRHTPILGKNDAMSEHFKRFRGQARYLDWDTTPMKMWEWTFKNNYFHKHVGEDFIKDWRVSTVWIGFNMGIFETILIFETMIFKETDKKFKCDFDMYQRRYKYYIEAVEGHKEVCDLLRDELFDKLISLEE